MSEIVGLTCRIQMLTDILSGLSLLLPNAVADDFMETKPSFQQMHLNHNQTLRQVGFCISSNFMSFADLDF